MKVTKESMNTSEVVTLDIPVTEDQLGRYERKEAAVQEIFPDLCRGLREFIKTGISPREWDEMFGQCGNGKCHKKCKYLKVKAYV